MYQNNLHVWRRREVRANFVGVEKYSAPQERADTEGEKGFLGCRRGVREKKGKQTNRENDAYRPPKVESKPPRAEGCSPMN